MAQQKPTRDAGYPTVDITGRLAKKYRKYLRPDIVSICIVQPRDRVWLEITRETETPGGLIDQSITRRDLGAVCRDEFEIFDPDDSIFINADKFAVELNAREIAIYTRLFDDEAYDEIERLFSRDRQGA